MQTFGAEPAAVGVVLCAAAYAHNAAILDANVATAAVGAKHARRLHPSVWLLADALIAAFRPKAFAYIGCAVAPDIFDAVT